MQVCCTQSPCPCDCPLLTHTSTGDTQTQFCLRLCGVPGSWHIQGLFAPSECLWWEWGLILNMNSPLLPSFWSFCFALGHAPVPCSRQSQRKARPKNAQTTAQLHSSHASKVMLKILQARLQQYANHELPDVQAGFRKGRGTRDQIGNIHWIIEKAREFKKNIYYCFID